MIDLSCTLDEKKAVKFLNEVCRYEVKYVEEPVFPLMTINCLNDLTEFTLWQEVRMSTL